MQISRFIATVAIGGTLALGGMAAQATTIVKDVTGGITAYPIPTVLFSDMEGILLVTAEFASGNTDTQVWAANTPGAGRSGVVGSNTESTVSFQWDLSGVSSEDTFPNVAGGTGLWELNYLGGADPLTKIVLFSEPKRMVTFDATEASPGSGAVGWDFTDVSAGSGATPDSTATYSIPVLPLFRPDHDNFFRLEIDVCGNNTTVGLGSNTTCGNQLVFRQDTDRVNLPEPGSVALVAGGLLGFAGWRRRRAS